MAPGDQRSSRNRPSGSSAGRRLESRRRLLVTVCDGRGRTVETGLGRWLAGIAPAGARGVVSVAVVSDARVRTLNRQFRRLDCATDVLSFPAVGQRSPATRSTPLNAEIAEIAEFFSTEKVSARSAASAFPVNQAKRRAESKPFLGDIVIARGVARRQARSAGHDERTELRVLALHGLLHLLGYDHERDGGRMARLERQLRRRAGLAGGLIERAER